MLTGLLIALLSAGPPLGATEGSFLKQAGPQARWAAFRATMAPEAWLLDPDVQPAKAVLDRRPDPAQARDWPGRSITSCDGSLAVSTGPVRLSDGAAGRFFTVWERQSDRGWRWVLDGMIDGEAVPPANRSSATAACVPEPAGVTDVAPEAAGTSGDGTLHWELVRDVDRDRHRMVVRYATPKGWATFEDATVH